MLCLLCVFIAVFSVFHFCVISTFGGKDLTLTGNSGLFLTFPETFSGMEFLCTFDLLMHCKSSGCSQIHVLSPI